MSGYVRLKGFLKKTHHYTLPHVRPQGYYFEDFFNVTKSSPRCDMSNHRFSFWPKYVGPIGFKPVFWLKTLGRTLCGTPNGDYIYIYIRFIQLYRMYIHIRTVRLRLLLLECRCFCSCTITILRSIVF